MPPSPPGGSGPGDRPGGWPDHGWGQPRDPGPLPLRPMPVGLLLAAALAVTRRHFASLAPLAVIISALTSLAQLVSLADGASVHDLVDGAVVTTTGSTATIVWPLAVGLLAAAAVSLIGGVFLSGVAAACAGADAMGPSARPDSRLTGRFGILAVASVGIAALYVGGFLLLVIPGIVAYCTWCCAAPALVLERSDIPTALRRSAALSTGHRWRIFGVVVAIGLISAVADEVVLALASAASRSMSWLGMLLVQDCATAVIGALTISWTAAVLAVLYVDLRVRREDLGGALRAWALRDRPSGATGPALG